MAYNGIFITRESIPFAVCRDERKASFALLQNNNGIFILRVEYGRNILLLELQTVKGRRILEYLYFKQVFEYSLESQESTLA